ncbi:hypothetical protein QTG56_24445 (plasmid) [Rossellomorea sp. AcN35-11]|nr:hypothetical protein [Rossellomorea aquimaris]WJV31785.1 hypothetical protein QTG56_24445 [Rossellomorea sp. AcN35-11]
MSNISVSIYQLREEYIESGRAKTYQEINCGDCVDFAEEIEFRHSSSISLSNDHFILETEGSDGWDGDETDQWDEVWLSEYNSLPPEKITVPELTEKIKGYHCWIYFENKHYDAECPEGVENLFELPFFQRYLNHQEEY